MVDRSRDYDTIVNHAGSRWQCGYCTQNAHKAAEIILKEPRVVLFAHRRLRFLRGRLQSAAQMCVRPWREIMPGRYLRECADDCEKKHTRRRYRASGQRAHAKRRGFGWRAPSICFTSLASRYRWSTGKSDRRNHARRLFSRLKGRTRAFVIRAPWKKCRVREMRADDGAVSLRGRYFIPPFCPRLGDLSYRKRRRWIFIISDIITHTKRTHHRPDIYGIRNDFSKDIGAHIICASRDTLRGLYVIN